MRKHHQFIFWLLEINITIGKLQIRRAITFFGSAVLWIGMDWVTRKTKKKLAQCKSTTTYGKFEHPAWEKISQFESHESVDRHIVMQNIW